VTATLTAPSLWISQFAEFLRREMAPTPGRWQATLRITLASLDAKHIHFDLQFLKPWKAAAKDNWLFEHWGDDETKVTWENSGNLPWPMARLMGPLIHKNLNHQFETGLTNLKKSCES